MSSAGRKKMLVLGAAGFIGNAACKRFRQDYDIIGIDNFSRPTCATPVGITFLAEDARKIDMLRLPKPDVILHLAGQASVVASLEMPLWDFRNNAELGLILARWAASIQPKCLIYSSTNKVYGTMLLANKPIHDWNPIHPQTPYAISKATAGLYIRDLCPEFSYDFRQSCIYGETQRGSEDQGWIGWLRDSIAHGREITCYGDGQQVRDLLHVEDLLDAYQAAIDRRLEPGSYTVGGGEENAVTFQQAVDLLGGSISHYRDTRQADQHYFVAASDGLRQGGWSPKINSIEWLEKNRVAVGAVA